MKGQALCDAVYLHPVLRLYYRKWRTSTWAILQRCTINRLDDLSVGLLYIFQIVLLHYIKTFLETIFTLCLDTTSHYNLLYLSQLSLCFSHSSIKNSCKSRSHHFWRNHSISTYNNVDPDKMASEFDQDSHYLSFSFWTCRNKITSTNLIGWHKH